MSKTQEAIKLLKKSKKEGYALADVMKVEEAIELLESEPEPEPGEFEPRPKCYCPACKNTAKPEPGEFTKKIKVHFQVCPKFNAKDWKRYHPQALCGALEIKDEYLLEACDRIDRLSAENKKMTDMLIAAGFLGNGTQIIGDGRYKELLKAEAEIKANAQLIATAPDLLSACEMLVKFTDEVLPQAGKLCFDVGNLNNALVAARPAIAQAKKGA